MSQREQAIAAPAIFVHPTADVSPDAVLGPGSQVWNGAKVREGAVLGERCRIGHGVYIDTRVTLGDGVKIQNGVSVYEGATIADGVFVGPHATFTNDLHPRAIDPDGTPRDEWQIVPTRVEHGASIGAGAVIVCGVTIGRWAMVGAGAVVTRDVPEQALVVGVPAQVAGYACRCGRSATSRERDGWRCDACPATV